MKRRSIKPTLHPSPVCTFDRQSKWMCLLSGQASWVRKLLLPLCGAALVGCGPLVYTLEVSIQGKLFEQLSIIPSLVSQRDAIFGLYCWCYPILLWYPLLFSLVALFTCGRVKCSIEGIPIIYSIFNWMYSCRIPLSKPSALGSIPHKVAHFAQNKSE